MEKMRLSKKLTRILGQIRFRPNLELFHNIPTILKEFETDFEEWRAPKHSDVSLYSPTKKKYLHLTSDSISYVSEGEEKDEAEYYINKVFLKLANSHGIKEIRWVGFRNTQILESKFKFEELAEVVFKKFYSSSKQITKISGSELKDVVFVFDSKNNDFYNHIQIGPVRQREALERFRAGFSTQQIDLKDNNIFIDLDVFKDLNIKTEEATKNLTEAIKENKRIFDDYMNYLSE